MAKTTIYYISVRFYWDNLRKKICILRTDYYGRLKSDHEVKSVKVTQKKYTHPFQIYCHSNFFTHIKKQLNIFLLLINV